MRGTSAWTLAVLLLTTSPAFAQGGSPANAVAPSATSSGTTGELSSAPSLNTAMRRVFALQGALATQDWYHAETQVTQLKAILPTLYLDDALPASGVAEVTRLVPLLAQLESAVATRNMGEALHTSALLGQGLFIALDHLAMAGGGGGAAVRPTSVPASAEELPPNVRPGQEQRHRMMQRRLEELQERDTDMDRPNQSQRGIM